MTGRFRQFAGLEASTTPARTSRADPKNSVSVAIAATIKCFLKVDNALNPLLFNSGTSAFHRPSVPCERPLTASMHVCRTVCTKERKLDEQNVNAASAGPLTKVQGRAEFAARRDGEPKVPGKGSQRPGFRSRIAARWRCLCSRSVSRGSHGSSCCDVSEQHGMFMAARSANPVATSMQPITRTSSYVIVGLIRSCGFQYYG